MSNIQKSQSMKKKKMKLKIDQDLKDKEQNFLIIYE